MKLILVDLVPALCEEWRKHFDTLPNVEVVNNYFESLPEFDCMVSAANSFGLMDGGVDEAIVRFFGSELMHRVQMRIIDEYLGEQPVGTAMIVETHHPKHPYIAHTPTMRVPLSIAKTDHPYNAMWAMLLAVRAHNQMAERKINIVACPGLGTFTGRVPFSEAARQMALAYKNFLKPPNSINWHYADYRQSEIRFGGDIE
jgi:O-acetyl-ADP-ribose deacetylase (regulator of RNase III)